MFNTVVIEDEFPGFGIEHGANLQTKIRAGSCNPCLVEGMRSLA